MYRYQLEKYRGRSTRHVCPQCGRKSVFTRYIDTENNNMYISDNVGKCNRLDKCGYHYTPHQYFTDNPWKRDKKTRPVPLFQNIGKWNGGTRDRKTCTPPPPKRWASPLFFKRSTPILPRAVILNVVKNLLATIHYTR